MGEFSKFVRASVEQPLFILIILLFGLWLIELFRSINSSTFLLLLTAGIILFLLNLKDMKKKGNALGNFLHRSWLTLDRDLTGLRLLIKLRWDMRRRMRENRGLHLIFMDVVKSNPNKICIVDIASNRSYTFSQLNSLSNRFANHFLSKGYGRGDIVALFMENGIEFVAAWIGLMKIGVITAWINSNLRMDSLAHCLKVSECKAIICSESLYQFYIKSKESGQELQNIQEFLINNSNKELNLNTKWLNNELDNEPIYDNSINFHSLLCFIYTSGTTGMPKPACIKHFRCYSMVVGCAYSFGILTTDRIYISMPLYHTAAGILGIGQVLFRGASCAIRQRFSASNFWKDCVDYECTASQYIGEICRYLLAQPIGESEKKHKVRLMFGNGLRAEIWKEFVERFKIKIGELYGSTEGTSNLVNVDGKIGACGFLPISPLTALIHPVRLVKVDDNGEIIRKPNGLAVPCRPGQTGAMVSSIRHDNPLLVFDGYLSKAETKKKVIQNVFRHGDSAFLTGDILHWDRLGYLYFRLRTGDTFRFKGENVSTTEVEGVLLPLKSIIDAVVYGIRIPQVEGSIGMAALVRNRIEQTLDEEFLQQLSSRLRAALPSYAIPRFVRICSSVDRTGTFKLVKTNLQRLALGKPSNNISSDEQQRVFIFDSTIKQYIPLCEDLRQRLEEGKVEQKELFKIFA
ncbi:hypothetical protein Mgra_00009666 [Meloidogyne graminicola]|uniref:Very long-chain fatty acid transport protein n=1 Tax=Meloidogyne graminicola TaxID=189291 RepID=A0A8S9ZBP4_9BILA|nr:hypothetical protein Mgra_00009666 [Meloidogyne graminicola]